MKILFIFAHPDDEAYGPAGTISKLAKDGNDVVVVSLCNGRRPGMEEVSSRRKEAFYKSCELLEAKAEIFDFADCKLGYDETLAQVEAIINKHSPDAVYTHNISDIHRDHRLVSECVMVATRPKPGSSVKELYMCELPSSTDWGFGQLGEGFLPNLYVDVTEFAILKMAVLELYETETYDYPDARSIESMNVLSKYRGKQVGVIAAEAFKQIFKIEI